MGPNSRMRTSVSGSELRRVRGRSACNKRGSSCRGRGWNGSGARSVEEARAGGGVAGVGGARRGGGASRARTARGDRENWTPVEIPPFCRERQEAIREL